MFSMTVLGMDSLLGGFALAAGVTVRAGVEVKSAGERMAGIMREDVPVDEGELRDSIEASTEGLSAEAGPTARHGPFVQWGTYKDPPQDFITRAGDEASDDLATKLLLVGAAF